MKYIVSFNYQFIQIFMLYIRWKKKKKACIFNMSFKSSRVHPHPCLGSCLTLMTKFTFNNNDNNAMY